YKANLAILETVMAVPDTVRDEDMRRAIEPVDEAAAGIDLDGDGRVGGTAREVHGLPAHYAGAAAQTRVVRYDYPAGTEFLHTVRYVDPDAPDLMSERLKELRYAVKALDPSDNKLEAAYAHEAREKLAGALPSFGGNASTGLSNRM